MWWVEPRGSSFAPSPWWSIEFLDIFTTLFSMTSTCSPPQSKNQKQQKGQIHLVYPNPFGKNSTTKVNPFTTLYKTNCGASGVTQTNTSTLTISAPASGIQNHITLVDLAAEGCRIMSQPIRWSQWCITLPKCCFFSSRCSKIASTACSTPSLHLWATDE